MYNAERTQKEKKLSFTKIISDIIFMYQFQLISIKIVTEVGINLRKFHKNIRVEEKFVKKPDIKCIPAKSMCGFKFWFQLYVYGWFFSAVILFLKEKIKLSEEVSVLVFKL